jgi:Tfp pilus assembly protein PilF
MANGRLHVDDAHGLGQATTGRRRRRSRANRRQESTPSPAVESPQARWLFPLGVAVVTVLAFGPAFKDGFVSWDDAKNFLDNPHYRGLGLAQLRWMWSTFHMGHYVPLSWMTLGLDYLVWGMNPAGYHATSVLLHALNAVLVYFLARRLFELTSTPERVLPAAFAALFFAVHPLRVESVAWITERRDALSLAFYLASLIAYLRFSSSAERRARWYCLSLAAFAGALLSKGTSVTLPAVLVLLNIYPLRRVDGGNWRGAAGRRLLLEVAPFALLSIGFSLLSVVALHPPAQLAPAAKVAVSAYSLEFYIGKTAIPVGLSPLYEMPSQVDPLAAKFLIAYLACIGLALAAWQLAKRCPAATASLVAFALISFPMLGIVQNGPQIAADRYTYHSGPALALFAASVLFFGLRVPTGARRAVAAIVVASFVVLTWRQTSVWRDSEQLWTRVLHEDPNSAIGHSGMANVMYKQGRVDEGLEHSRRAVTLAPKFSQAYNDVGVGLATRGELDEAAAAYREAIALDSAYEEPVNNLGVVLVRQGDIDAGIQDYRRALSMNPDYADAHVNWGNALVRAHRPADAIQHYQEALAIRPQEADAHFNWGVALAQQGQFAGAAQHFRETLAIDPNHAEGREYLARAMSRVNRP